MAHPPPPPDGPFDCTVSILGRVSISHTLHRGRTFAVFAGDWKGEPIALKAAVPGGSGRGIGTADHHGIETSLYLGDVGIGIWNGAEPRNRRDRPDDDPGLCALTERVTTALLVAEANIVQAAAGAWNHSTWGLATWDGQASGPWRSRGGYTPDAADDQLRIQPVLVMPRHDASPLADLDRDTARRTYLRMLPALWDALCVMPHGDLSEHNLLLDRQDPIFRIIDPGVLLSSPTAERKMYANSRIWFTTSPRGYPLLMPFAEFPGTGTLAERLGHSQDPLHLELFDRPVTRGALGGSDPTRSRPNAPDLLAMGLLYFRLATGEELFEGPELFAGDLPVWCGEFGESRASYERTQRVRAALEAGFLERRLARSTLRPRERALVDSLCNLRVTSRTALMGLMDRI